MGGGSRKRLNPAKRPEFCGTSVSFSRFLASCNEAKPAQTRRARCGARKVRVARESVDVARLKVYVACVEMYVSWMFSEMPHFRRAGRGCEHCLQFFFTLLGLFLNLFCVRKTRFCVRTTIMCTENGIFVYGKRHFVYGTFFQKLSRKFQNKNIMSVFGTGPATALLKTFNMFPSSSQQRFFFELGVFGSCSNRLTCSREASSAGRAACRAASRC